MSTRARLRDVIENPDGIEELDRDNLPKLMGELEVLRTRLRLQLERAPSTSTSTSDSVGKNQDEESEEHEDPEQSWRERLWTCPAETRLNTSEVAEAVGRGENWVHQRTPDSVEDRIPHRKRNGRLVFLAGEVREWLNEQEEVIVAGSSTPSAAERHDFEVVGGEEED